jgi:hypothetical protein
MRELPSSHFVPSTSEVDSGRSLSGVCREVAELREKADGLDAQARALEERSSRRFDAAPGSYVTGSAGRRRSGLQKRTERAAEWSLGDLRKAKVLRDKATDLRNRAARLAAPKVDKSADESVAAFIRSTIGPGSTIYNVAAMPLTVKRANAKSVTTESGSNYRYSELIPAHEDGRPMNGKEFVAAYRSWKSAQAPTTPEIEPSESTDSVNAACGNSVICINCGGSGFDPFEDDDVCKNCTGPVNAASGNTVSGSLRSKAGEA